MEESQHFKIIPEQRTGVAIDAKTSVLLGNQNEAIAFFAVVKSRLKDVNHWHVLAGNLSAKFLLVNKDGFVLLRSPKVGDYFKIDIPGPGTISGEGYDWVQIEELMERNEGDAEEFSFTLRPSANPLTGGKDIAHFFSNESTCTFLIARIGKKVTAAIYDRNAKPNKDAGPIVDKVRNAITGTAGVLRFAKIQWQRLADGLCKKDFPVM